MTYVPPKVGEVYETCVKGLDVLLCIRVRKIGLFIEEGSWCTYDFLVLDGNHPPIRTWSDFSGGSVTMEKTMDNFKFKKIA